MQVSDSDDSDDHRPTTSTSGYSTADGYKTKKEYDKTKFIEASGFVVGAFAVTVDGESYPDLESFYTSELQRLPARMEKAGYDSTYDIDFKAQVGFSDLYEHMTVYLLAQGSNGYQATTYIDRNGGFKTYLPRSEIDVDYRVRANKRIRVILTKAETHEKKVLCYNFSAKETAAHFKEDASPVILDDFTTAITAYDCQEESTSGVTIPQRP